MVTDLVLFMGLAIVAVGSALGMLFSRNAVYSTLNLILNFCTMAVLYLMLNAPFIALVQIAVYAGAIMVLFLFVIMLLGAERLRTSKTLAWQQPLAIFLGLLLLVEAAYIMILRPTVLPPTSEPPPGFGTPEMIGLELFDTYLLPFEVVSVLLLVAMIGSIVLTKRRQREIS